MNKPDLFLIDTTAFCYRAFYALKNLATSFGQPTNAIYGFVNILNKILREKKPDYLAACFDVSRDTFRQRKFAEYKIQRPPMPESLSSQIPLIKEIIAAYGITMYELEGYEADDLIASLSRKAEEKGLFTTVVSSDKDILQLVGEELVVFNPYKDEGVIYDKKKVFERFGITPGQIPDIIALMGDDADNIPGVPGIGEKTAVELIKNFHSCEELVGNLDKLRQPRIKKVIEDNIEKIKLNKELVVLDNSLNLDFNLDNLKIAKPDHKELFRIFKYLEFKKLLNDLPLAQDKPEESKAVSLSGRELKALVEKSGELFLYGKNLSDLKFFAQDKFFQLDEIDGDTKDILSDPEVKKIGHGLKRIKIFLAEENISIEGLSFDTMIAGYLINPSKSEYNLCDLAWDYLDKMVVPESIDSLEALTLILRLKPKLEQEMRDKSLFELFFNVEMPLVKVLAKMELEGIKFDLKLLKEVSSDIEKKLIGLIGDIYQLSGCQFNINSPKQLRDILFDRLKLPVVKRSKTGPSTDEEVLRVLSGSHRLPLLLLEYRQLMKLKTTYFDTLPELVNPKTGRIHTSLNQTGTETGRLSSSNPNLQNIPVKTELGRKIRQAIIAFDQDSYLFSCDYAQMELAILAHLSKDDNLVYAFKQNKDIHKTTASLIYGLEEKDVSDQMREVAKRINFGIIYGLSSYGLSRDLNITIDQAQGFIDTYFARYAKVKQFIEKQIEKVEKDGFVTTILGRRRYIPEIKHKNQGIRSFAQRKAINTPIQGSASDIIKLAMVKLDEQIKQRGLNTRMILQIHDELLFNVPERELKQSSELIKEIMENVIVLDVPIRISIKKGRNWLEMEEIV